MGYRCKGASKIAHPIFENPFEKGDEILAKSKIQDLTILTTLLADNVVALALIDKAVFLEKTLSKLQKQIEEFGTITEMCQGSYNIQRANPALNAYNITIKNYSSIMKQLNDMLPKQEKAKGDGFDEF